MYMSDPNANAGQHTPASLRMFFVETVSRLARLTDTMHYNKRVIGRSSAAITMAQSVLAGDAEAQPPGGTAPAFSLQISMCAYMGQISW